MNERKSWRWIVGAYGGVIAVVVLITVFVMHTASHEDVVLTNGAATPTPTVVDVFSGIRSDPVSPWIHAKHVAEAASPTPVPSPSGSPGASPTPHAKSIVAAAKHPKHAGRHSASGEAETGQSTEVAMAAEHSNSAPVQLAQVPPAIEHAAAPPTDAPTAAPAVATAAPQPAEDPNAPVYEPQRVVDAQVRVAAQPDFPEIERQRGAHGTSVVLVTIDPKGNVVSASIGSSSGYPGLDRAAIAAARASQFVAPRINGHPATETYRIVYDFAP